MTCICKNCGVSFEGVFCPNCAQKASTGRLNVSDVVHEMWHNFTHTDRSVLGFIAGLFTKPGIVIREYIAGKRKKYFNPYTFFLVSSAILIFITKKVFHYEDSLYHYNNEFGQFTSEQYTIIILFSLPFMGGILRMIFSGRDINYSEWITFLIFSYCLINVIQIVIQLIYFPLIKYHHTVLLSYTELSPYVILFFLLVKFIQPRNFGGWTKCTVSILVLFFFVEWVAKIIALWLANPISLSRLISNYSVF